MIYNIQKQHSKGKLHAIERLELLFDPGFQILVPKTEEEYDGVITAVGKVNGFSCCAFAQDFACQGGSMGRRQAAQIAALMKLAIRRKYPLVCINDSVGARLQDGVGALDGYGEIFRLHTLASGVIPQLSVILGPCAGGAAYAPALTDFIFIANDIGRMFITGEKVIQQVTHEQVDPAYFGRAEMLSQKSGVCHFCYSDEASCLSGVKSLITLLQTPYQRRRFVRYRTDDSDLRPGLNEIVPESKSKPYDMRKIIQSVADENAFFYEVQAAFAKNIIIGFSQICGCTVGFVANQTSMLAGSLDCDASDKAARFIRFCDNFNIPIVSFTDTPGYFPGVAEETKGIIRHGAKMLYAFAEASVPKINFIIRQAFGGAYIAMNSMQLGADAVFAWKSAQVGIMGKDAADKVLGGKSGQEQLTEDLVENGSVTAYIDPAETRKHIVHSLAKGRRKRKLRHGNIPL